MSESTEATESEERGWNKRAAWIIHHVSLDPPRAENETTSCDLLCAEVNSRREENVVADHFCFAQHGVRP